MVWIRADANAPLSDVKLPEDEGAVRRNSCPDSRLPAIQPRTSVRGIWHADLLSRKTINLKAFLNVVDRLFSWGD